MGAAFASRIYDPSELGTAYDKYVADFDKIRERFSIDCDNSRFEYGSGGYSGEIGQFNSISPRRIDRPFDTEDDAEAFISKYHKKRDAAFAVRFYSPCDEPSAKTTKAQEKVDAAYKNLVKVCRAISDEIISHPSDFITCKHCKSRCNRTYFRGDICQVPSCPVCRKSIMLKGQETRRNSAETKLEKARSKMIEVQRQESKKGKILWLVGGWVGI